jgi:uncharacterized membrane protein
MSKSPTSSATAAQLRHHAPLLLVLAIATWTRWHRIGELSLWLDEAHTFSRAALPLDDLFQNALHNLHTPTYFAIIHYWMALGDSEAMLRAPSAIFGLLTVGLTYAGGVTVGGRFVGFGAGLFMALWPTQIGYAQEARMYTLLALGATLTMTAFLWLAAHPERAGINVLTRAVPSGELKPAHTAWLCVAIGLLIALWAHNLAVLVLVAAGVAGLACIAFNMNLARPLLANAGRASVIVLLGWGWWLPFLASQQEAFESGHDWGGIDPSLLIKLGDALYLLSARWWVAEVVLGALALVGVYALRRKPALLSVLLAFAIAAPVGLILISLHKPVLAHRFIIWVSVPTAILMASGISIIPRRNWQIVALLVVAGWVAWRPTREYYTRAQKEPWREASTVVTANYTPDSVVFYAPTRTAVDPFFYYLHRAGLEDVIHARSVSNVRRSLKKKKWVWLVVRDHEGTARVETRRDVIEQYADLSWQHSYHRRLHVFKYFVKQK